MNKKLHTSILFLFISCCFLFPSAVFSQWTKSVGGKNAEYGQNITADANGNVYVIGNFRGKADFDPGPDSFFLSISCPCDESDPLKPDVFFAKYSKAGVLIWAKKVGGSGNDDGKDIGVDTSGNVYITGTFELTADFDPSSSTHNLTSTGGLNIFLAKYNSKGKLIWANNIGTSSFDYGNALSISESGNITLAGSFNGNVDFDPSPNNVILDAGSSSDPFFALYNTNGGLLWVKDISGNGEAAAKDIYVDSSGNIYLTGDFFGTSDFDPSAGNFFLTGTSAKDAFYAKYNSSGEFLWADRIGGGGDQSGLSIAADNKGNAYASGYYQGTIDFDPGVGVFNLSSSGFFNAYLLKLNSDGSFGWVKDINGSQDDIGFSVTVDAKQNIYAAGYFTGAVNLDASNTLISAGSTDIYILRYTPAGKLLYANQSGGSSDDWAAAITTGNNFVYVTGYYTGSATFDFQDAITLTSAGNADVYIAKFKPGKNISSVSSQQVAYSFQKTDASKSFDIFPNPIKDVLHIHLNQSTSYHLLITDIAGNPLIKMNMEKQDENIVLSKLATGTYFIQLSDNNNRLIGIKKIFKE